MRRGLLCLLLCLAACAPAEPPRPAAAAREPRLEVDVTRSGGRWTAEFRFPGEAPAWLFLRSPLTASRPRPWRPESWTVETPGVRLERRGRFDLLVSDAGPVPPRVRVRFTPFAEDIEADYDPALIFTDGSVALFTEQFDAVPLASAAEAERLSADRDGLRVPDRKTLVTFRDEGRRILYAGRRLPSIALAGVMTYVLFGPAEPIVTDDMSAIIDPALPAWIRGALARSVPAILADYAAELGPAPGPKPVILVSWAGPTPGVSSMGGSTLPGMIVMTYEGDRILAETARGRGNGLWFIAHEAAHFWLGQAVRYGSPRESWITEGGADLLAVRTVAGIDPDYDWRGELQREIDDCARLSAGRGVARALERGEFRAHYACGAVFAMVAEAASGRPFVRFVRALIDANRADREVTREDWLAELDRVSGDPSLSRDIGLMLDAGAADPKAVIASLFTRAGIPHRRGADGMPRLA